MNFSTYFLLIGIPLILGLWAKYRVTTTFNRYKKITVSSGLTGAEAAEKILQASSITDVEVVPIDGMLGDHYDPSNKRLNLSSKDRNDLPLHKTEEQPT